MKWPAWIRDAVLGRSDRHLAIIACAAAGALFLLRVKDCLSHGP